MNYKFFGLCIFLLVIFAGSAVLWGEDTEEWQIILDQADPLHDDFGPGTYLYPTNHQFAPYQGLLDIEHFTVKGGKEEVLFEITFGQITNPWNAPLGFSHQLIEIYLDDRPGGHWRPYKPGAGVVFSPKASWDSFLKITGWGVYYLAASNSTESEPIRCDLATVTVLADQKTIQLRLPLQLFESLEELEDAAFYLLVGGYDGFGPDNFRVVKPKSSEWYFGGGDDSGYHSNVIDLLVPPGKSQQKILRSYDPTSRVRAVIEPVSRPNLVRKGLIYLISFLIILTIWFGWRKRNQFFQGQ